MSVAGRASSRQLPTAAILAIIGLGAFITALDQTVVVTALPSVMVDLKVPITQLDRVSWVITSYLLGYTVAMPPEPITDRNSNCRRFTGVITGCRHS